MDTYAECHDPDYLDDQEDKVEIWRIISDSGRSIGTQIL